MSRALAASAATLGREPGPPPVELGLHQRPLGHRQLGRPVGLHRLEGVAQGLAAQRAVALAGEVARPLDRGRGPLRARPGPRRARPAPAPPRPGPRRARPGPPRSPPRRARAGRPAAGRAATAARAATTASTRRRRASASRHPSASAWSDASRSAAASSPASSSASLAAAASARSCSARTARPSATSRSYSWRTPSRRSAVRRAASKWTRAVSRAVSSSDAFHSRAVAIDTASVQLGLDPVEVGEHVAQPLVGVRPRPGRPCGPGRGRRRGA